MSRVEVALASVALSAAMLLSQAATVGAEPEQLSGKDQLYLTRLVIGEVPYGTAANALSIARRVCQATTGGDWDATSLGKLGQEIIRNNPKFDADSAANIMVSSMTLYCPENIPDWFHAETAKYLAEDAGVAVPVATNPGPYKPLPR
ncbi:gp76 [Mycobacterium phage PLot]|uniref:DUF732 domain-containing protein n=17 Tax=Plotvirus TaxID=2169613 RepID=Q19Y73_9CAUD|nr:gp76 [Mycobacterium phage Troll4]YP_002241971.1 gp78 [Mycobacterium phage Gumball]YP_655268.1 gp72 [Mycobacterium phage PBI1]YP_655455.1 gp76 [Mycobacterium phage PLot]ACD49659.1 hypothetical protein Adjutor_74 [Mycobacterium phage Adjutor]ACI06362.1 hypothetical protein BUTTERSCOTCH_74 [Mycobacterium phage Butterscotch]AEK10287.1 hypothetical protein PBI_SIRHARLEY_78 [Mycobacterium phage SirHarley]AER49829.1 hypothetical protein NOVA_76 [Mycobacterium phage Nova]AVP43172.1 hypothetical 